MYMYNFEYKFRAIFSLGNQIGPEEMSLTVSQFARKNNLVIHYVETKSDTENNNDMQIKSDDDMKFGNDAMDVEIVE